MPLGDIFEETASQAVSSDNDEEDEAMGQMMKRISVMSSAAPRPSLLQGMNQTASLPGAAPGDLAKAPHLVTGFTGQSIGANPPTLYKAGKRLSSMLKLSPSHGKKMSAVFEGLGSIDEMLEDAEGTVRVESSVDRDVLGQLRRDAEQGDGKVDRYSMLVQQSMNIVSEVKSALYDADDSPQDSGAELLLEEVRDMLTNVIQTSLAEAAQLQKTSESWLGLRKRMAYQLKNNHTALEVSIERRAESARESNAENRAECDRLWRKIQDLESEVDSLSKLRMQGSTGTSPLSPGSDDGSAFDSDGAPISGGLTLEGAHSLLRSFNATLRPHVSDIIPQRADWRSSSEAIALEFLNACGESMKQVPSSDSMKQASLVMRSKSSPPGINVDGNKGSANKDLYGGDLLQEEQRRLLQKVGQSY